MQRGPRAISLCLLISGCTHAVCCVLCAGFRETNFPKSLVLLASGILHSSISGPYLCVLALVLMEQMQLESQEKKEKYGV